MKLRLRELKEVVDYFVIAEGAFLFDGTRRDKLNFRWDLIEEDMRERVIYLTLNDTI